MTAAENRKRKAWALAPALHRRGLTVEELLRLPYAAKSPKIRTVTRFCRTAYQEAVVDERPPHAAASETWLLTADLLEWMAAHPDDPRVPPQDRLDDRANWSLEEPCPTSTISPSMSPAPEAVATTSTTTTSTGDASRSSTLSPTSGPERGPSGRPTSAPVGGGEPWRDAGFPRQDGATCGCGVWHRRYGPQGHGALCDTCRTAVRAAS